MVTRVVMGCACGMVVGMLVHAGVATGAEPGGEGPGRPMPPTYNPETGAPQYPGSGVDGGPPSRGRAVKSGPASRGPAGQPPGGAQREGSGDPLKGLNVHKATSSEDQKHQCHDATNSFYYKC